MTPKQIEKRLELIKMFDEQAFNDLISITKQTDRQHQRKDKLKKLGWYEKKVD